MTAARDVEVGPRCELATHDTVAIISSLKLIVQQIWHHCNNISPKRKLSTTTIACYHITQLWGAPEQI